MRNLPDPRVIFALVFVLTCFAVVIREDVRLMTALLSLTIVCSAVLGVNFRMLYGRLKRLWQVLLAVSLIRSIFAPSGTILLSLWEIPLLTAGGIQMGVLVLFRLALFVISAAMFTLYPVRTLIQGMVQIKMPYEIAYMVSVGIRFIPQLAQEMKDSLTALQLRGVVIEELKFRKRISLYSYLLLPVIVSSLQNAKELAMSMEMRAFRAMRERTSYYDLTFTFRDIAMLCGTLLFTFLAAAALIIF